MEQLAELRAHLDRLPHQIATCRRLDDALQSKLYAISLALRSLADLEANRTVLERAQQRIATLSQAITGEWSAELRQAANNPAAPFRGGPALTRSFSSSTTPAGASSPLGSAASTPSRLVASQSSLLPGSGSRDAALRQALKKEVAAFARAHSRALDAFDARWTCAFQSASPSHDSSPTWSATPSLHPQARRKLNTASIADGPRPMPSWIRPNVAVRSDGEAAPVPFPPESIDLLQKVLRFGIGSLPALASSIIRSSISDGSGAGSSQAERLSPDEISAVFGIVVAARGAAGALELAEQIFVQVIQQSAQLDGRDCDVLVLAVLDMLHTIDVRQGDEAASQHDAVNRNVLEPSPALEVDLLAFLDASRRWEAIVAATHPDGLGQRRASTGPSAWHAADLSGSLWSRSATSVAGPLSAIGSSAADAWSAGLHTGMTTLSGLFAAGGTMGSKLIGRTGLEQLITTAEAPSSNDGSPRRNGGDEDVTAAVKALSGRKGNIKVPPTLSFSRFVKPTTGVDATTAQAHADGADLRLSSPHPRDTAGQSPNSDDSSTYSLFGAATVRGQDAARQSPSRPATAPRRSFGKDAHSALEAIAAASSSPSPESSPVRPMSTRRSSRRIPLVAAEAILDPGDPVAVFAPRILHTLVGAADADRSTNAAASIAQIEQALPLVCRLSNRLLRQHFPASRFPEESRKIRLVIIVRWFAFAVLRDLVTRPESLGRSLCGGKLIWAVHSKQLAHDEVLWTEDVQRTANDKRPRGFEDIWISDELSCRALNGLHRALYGAIVKCAQVSSLSPGEPSTSDPLIAGCGRLLDLFGAGSAAHGGLAERATAPAGPAQQTVTDFQVFSLARKEAAAFTRAMASSFLEATERATATPSALGVSPVEPVREKFSFENVEALLQQLSVSPATARQAAVTDAYDLPLFYAAFDAVKGKAYVSMSLSKVDAFVQETRQAFAQQQHGLRLSLGHATNRPPTRPVAHPSCEAGLASLPQKQTATAGLSSGFCLASSSAGPPVELADWESPPCSPFAEKTLDSLFQLDAKIIETAQRDGMATPISRPTQPLAGPALDTLTPRQNPAARFGARDIERAQAFATPQNQRVLQDRRTSAIDMSRLSVEDVQRGVLALLRRGYSVGGAPSLLTLFQRAAHRAEEQEAFVDAALFRQTAALLRYCSRIDTSLVKAFGQTHADDFAPLIDHILRPFQEADQARDKHRARTQARLMRLEASLDDLVTKARILLSSLQELRTRCWYACEIRANSEVVSSIVVASLGLYGHRQQHRDEASPAGDPGWLESLDIHDLNLTDNRAKFVRRLDPAFQRIVRDAGSFFASPLWNREALLAKPFLGSSSSRRRRGAPLDEESQPQAIFTFGAGTKALLHPGEMRPETLVGFETFLQRVQLCATGLLLSEAMSVVTEVEAACPPSASAKADPDVWVQANLGRVETSLQHRDAHLASQLSTLGVKQLLQRFDLHPSPHHKMRALFNITRLVVTQLSFAIIPPEAESPATVRVSAAMPPPTDTATPSDHRQRPASASNRLRVAEGHARTSIWQHGRRATMAVEDSVARLGTSPSLAATSGAPSPTRASYASRPASISGVSSQAGRRPRRALSMYVDDDEFDEDDPDAPPRLGEEEVGMPSIHNLLSLMGPFDVLTASTTDSNAGTEAQAAPQKSDTTFVALEHRGPPSTDTLLNVLESILIHHLSPDYCCSSSADKDRGGRRLRNLYMHLQLICAFTPTTILDWKEEGKALWDFVLAASSVRTEVATKCLDLARQGQEPGERRSFVKIAQDEGLQLSKEELDMLTS